MQNFTFAYPKQMQRGEDTHIPCYITLERTFRETIAQGPENFVCHAVHVFYWFGLLNAA